MWEQFAVSHRWFAALPPSTATSPLTVIAAVLVASGLFSSACGSAAPRSADKDYSDAATKQEESKAQAMQSAQDASTHNGMDGMDAMVASQDAASAAQACGGDSCKEPATCKADRCSCPEGYEDVNGDGSECKDVDECKARTADCSRGAPCKNEPGGYKCLCNAPAYVEDGDDCTCAEGYERDDNALCVGSDGRKCADGIDCKSGTCEGGICCAQSCGEPGECHVTDGAKCSDDGKDCVYPLAKDGASCDDNKACSKDGTCKKGECQESREPTDCNDGNPCTDDSCEEPIGCRNQNNTGTCDDGSPCTREDKCAGGQCSGTTRDCSIAADLCNVGACDDKSGECIKEPRKTSATCDDADSCTVGDSCKDGACVSSSSACGANATACTAGVGGEPNACTCAESFVSFQGHCVPMNDECQRANPCSADAVCTDPSNTDGDLTCACKAGFSGNGVECVAADPCATNPCGMEGACTSGSGGTHTCICPAGTREVAGKCGCDLTGSFGVRAIQTVSWADINRFVEDGAEQIETFWLQRLNYGADGNLQIELMECGGSSYNICSVPFEPLLGAEAYGQWVPNAVWGTDTMPRTNLSIALADSQPGAAFTTGQFAIINGIKLDDPLGEWPTDRRQVAGSPDSEGSPVNGATWLDSDNDGALGLTTMAVSPGGESVDGEPPNPPRDFGAASEQCPRRNSGERSKYAYPPAIPNGSLSVQRVKRIFAAQRSTLAFEGTIDSCDAISGTVTGPDNGNLRLNARIAGCVRVNGSGESACGAGTVDFVDGQPQKQHFSDSTFKMKRLANGATCQEVWAATFD